MSRLRQLQDDGRHHESSMETNDRRLRSADRATSSCRTPTGGKRERVVPRTERPDTDLDVMAAAEHFLARSRAAGTMQTGSEFSLHKVFLERTEVSQLRRLVNPHNGQPMWPDVLVTLVDMYWDDVANPNNEWAWKHFVGGRVVEGLLANLLNRIEQAYSIQEDTRTPEQIREEREANWDRIAERAKQFTPNRLEIRRVKRAEAVEGPSDQDFWGDELDEWEAILAKKRAARKRKQEEGL